MTKRVCFSGVSSTCIQENKSLCLTGLVSKVLRNSLPKITKGLSIRYILVLKSSIKKDNKTTLVTLRISIPEYKNLKNFDKLSEKTVDLWHLINEYGKKHRLRNYFIVHLVDDQLQMIEKDESRMYQI